MNNKNQIGIFPPTDFQNAHRSFNSVNPTFSNPSVAITNSSPDSCTSGTPGSDAFVNLCALGSPVWKKLANAPA